MSKQTGKQSTPEEAPSRRERDDLAVILEIIEKVENGPETKKRMEEYPREYGTLTTEDLMKQFTI